MATTTKTKNRLEMATTNGTDSHFDAVVNVKPLRLAEVNLRITGVSPYMQCRFSEKAINKIVETQKAGSQARSKKVREARDFDADYQAAQHRFPDGSCGIPAPAFRNAAISACKLVGYHMTKAKLSIWIVADGCDVVDGMPLVRIKGKPEQTIMPVRNASGVCDLRARPMWREWCCVLTIQFDLDQFSPSDVINLMNRAGLQVGIGEGRNDSKESNGLGYGTFKVELMEE